MPAFHGLLKNIATDSLFVLIIKILGTPIVYLVNLVIIRLYGAEQAGNYFIAFNIIAALTTCCCLGLQTGFLRYTAALQAVNRIGDIKKSFWQILLIVSCLSILVGISLFFYSERVAEYFHSPNLPRFLRVMAVSLPFSVMLLFFSETVRALGGARRVVFQQYLLSSTVFLGMTVLFYFGCSPILKPPSALSIAFFVSICASLAFLVASPWSLVRQKGRTDKDIPLKTLIKYSWPIFLTSLVGLSISGLDSLILGLFTSPKEVAYYSIVAKTAPLITIPLLAVNMIAAPLFAQFHQSQDIGGLEVLAQTSARWVFFIALPIGVSIILAAPIILGIFGEDFVQAQYALVILTLGQLINVSTGSVGVVLLMTGQQWSYTAIQVIGNLITIPLMALAAHYYGFNGLAVITAINVAGINVVMAWSVRHRLGIKIHAQKIFRANLVVLVGIIAFFLAKPLAGVIGGTICFILIYIIFMMKKIKAEIQDIVQPQVLGDCK